MKIEIEKNNMNEKSSLIEDKTKILGLKHSEESGWYMREDVKRVLLYELYKQDNSIGGLSYLHPSEAIILTLFNRKRTIEQVIKKVSYLFNESFEKAEEIVGGVINKWEKVLEESNNGYIPNYDPKDFIIDAWKVDLESPRLCRPISLTFHVTDDCMRDCIYCNVQKRKTKDLKLLPLKRWEELADEVKKIGIASITLSGGDPFMHEHIIQIISFFTSRNIPFFITTKAHITERKAKELASLGIKYMQYSIDAPYPEVADYLTNTKGFFMQAVGSIKNLVKNGIKVKVNAIMTSYNILTAPTLVNLLADLGVIKVTISSYGRSIYTHRDQFFVDEYAGKWVEEKVKKLSDNLKGVIKASFRYYQDERYLPKEAKEEKFRTRARCTASRWGFIILSDGKVIPCDECPVENDFIVGDVTNKSIMDVWKSSLNDNFVTPSRELFKGTVCYECVEFEGCSINGKRCFRDAFKAYGSVYTAPPDCPIAPESPRLY